MREVAILLLLALMLNGCSTTHYTTVQAASSGATWQAQLTGGDGAASGFSFLTQFTVDTSGTLAFTTFQFLTSGTCFPVTGEDPSGSMILTVNSSTNQVTGPFSMTVLSGGNTLTLSGEVTGTENGNNGTLEGASITGNWSLAGGTGCSAPGGSFSMAE